MLGFRNLESFIRGLTSALPSNPRGRSPVPELGTPGSERGVLSNEHSYRDPVSNPHDHVYRCDLFHPGSGVDLRSAAQKHQSSSGGGSTVCNWPGRCRNALRETPTVRYSAQRATV